MKRKTRNILLCLGGVALVSCALAGYGIYRIYSFLSPVLTPKEIPQALLTPGVLKGQGMFTKSELFKLDRQSYIETIREGSVIEDEKERQKEVSSQLAKSFFGFEDIKVFGNEIIAAGKFGAYVFDQAGSLKRHITFEPTTEKIKIGPYEQDTYQANLDNLRVVRLTNENYGFLSWGSVQGVRVFDENGNQIWAAGKENVDLTIVFKSKDEIEKKVEQSTHVLEAAVGDLDNDGISEFIVARKNDGIRAFDRNGNEKWHEADDFPNDELAVIDIDGDGRNEVVELGRRIREGNNGKAIRETKGSSDDAFLFVSDKNKRIKIQSLDFFQGKMTYSGEDGTKLFETEVPLSEIKKKPEKVDVPGFPEMSYVDDSDRVAFPKAVWIQSREGNPRYLAVVASFIGLPRSNFYVFDEKGVLVYHELLPENAETMAAVPGKNGSEEILLGGKETIWKYSLN